MNQNFAQTERIVRFIKRIQSSKYFKENLRYLGLLFQACIEMNDRVEMVASKVEIGELLKVEFENVKFFNMDDIYYTINDIWEVGEKIVTNQEEVFAFTQF